MQRSRIGQNYPILYLAGSAGSGKSKLAEKVHLAGRVPCQLVPWVTTRPLTSDTDRLKFRRVTEDELVRHRQANQLVFECKPEATTFALLRSDVLTATTATVGLVFGPSAAAKQLRAVGFHAHVMYVRSLGRRGRPSDSIFEETEDRPPPDLIIEEYYPNNFRGGLEIGVAHLEKVIVELFQPLAS